MKNILLVNGLFYPHIVLSLVLKEKFNSFISGGWG